MRLNLTDTVQAARERRGTRRKRRRFDPTGVPLEHQEQANLMKWAFDFKRQIPELELLFAIPNQGAARLKNLQTEGVMRGVPDLFLAVPREEYVQDQKTGVWFRPTRHGLFIELKRVKGGKVSPEQYVWMEKLTNQGYKCVVARGFEAAKQEILEYLGRAGG